MKKLVFIFLLILMTAAHTASALYNEEIDWLAVPKMIKPEEKYSRVSEANTKISMAPTIITEIKSSGDLKRIVSGGHAATAVLNVNKKLEVLGSGFEVIGTVSSMYEYMRSGVIPAFRVNDPDAAKAISQYLKNSMIEDAFVISNNPALVKLAREDYTFVRGIVEFENLSPVAGTNELMYIRDTANSNLSRIAVIPAESATKNNVQFLQDRLVTVWVKEKIADEAHEQKLVALHGIITSGANGIVTGSPEKAKQALALYNHDTTIVRKPFLIGHRGVPDLAPENTIEGCELAFTLGADSVEADIYLSKAGKDQKRYLVVMHDEDISRTTNGSGKIWEMTIEELGSYLANKHFTDKYPTAKIPTLDQYFQKFTQRNQIIFVEIKSSDPETINEYNELIKKVGYDSHLATISFNEEQLKRIKAKMPEMSLGYLWSGVSKKSDIYKSLRDALEKVQTLNSSLMPDYTGIDREFMEVSKHRGMTIWPWTLNNKAEIIKYFKMGVYGMSTNCSQYFSDWAADITPKQGEFTIKPGEALSLTANVKTYKGDIKEVIPDVLVLAGGAELKVRGNNITGIKTGEVYVTLRYNCKLSDERGDTFDIYTQPVKIRIEK